VADKCIEFKLLLCKIPLVILIFNYLLLILCVLLSVAFITLLERKILGYIQIRKGPNKVSINGIFQPFADAVKLITKENNQLNLSNYLIYFSIPFLAFFLILIY